MKLLLRAACVQKDPDRAKIVNYDKSSKRRPAWIQIKGLPRAEVRHSVADISRAKEILNWQPEVGLAEVLFPNQAKLS